MSGAVSIKRNRPVSPSPPPQTTSRNVTDARNKSSGDHRRDGQGNTKESHPHRIAMPNRAIQFSDPKDLPQEEKTLIQNLSSDIRMIENDEHTEQYIEWRRQEIKKANNWWTDGVERPFWHERFQEPVSPHDEKVQKRFDIAHFIWRTANTKSIRFVFKPSAGTLFSAMGLAVKRTSSDLLTCLGF